MNCLVLLVIVKKWIFVVNDIYIIKKLLRSVDDVNFKTMKPISNWWTIVYKVYGIIKVNIILGFQEMNFLDGTYCKDRQFCTIYSW